MTQTDQEVSTVFQQLPKELLHLVLSYDGTIKYRHAKRGGYGMYMNQLSKNDPRYDLLRTIKVPNCRKLTHHWRHEQEIRYTYSYSICISNLYTIMKGTDRRNMNLSKYIESEYAISYSIYDASSAINQHYFIRT